MSRSRATVRSEGEADHPRHWLGVIQIVLGSALLLLAGKKIASRPPPGTEVEMPKFLASLANTTPRRSVKVGFALATLNPKHVVFMLPIGALAVEQGLALLEVAMVILIFSLLASISVAAPTVMHLLAPERLRRVIDPPFRWMVRNMNWVSAAILVFIGTNTIGKGVGNL